jgi:hypothetical protein
MHHVIDFLQDAAHAPGCTRWLHSAAECSCGLSDARCEAEDAVELLVAFVTTTKNLEAAWEAGDIAGPVNELAALARAAAEPAS